MEQYSQHLMSVMKSNRSSISRQYSSSWEEEAFAEDGRGGPLGGFVWPPRSYSCSFCRREFNSAQALGGHMNVHRRQKAAKLKQLHHTSSAAVLNHHHAANNNNNTLLITSTDRPQNHIKKEEKSICESSFDPPAAGFSPSSRVSSMTALLGSTQDQSLHDSSTTSDTKSCVFDEDFLVPAHGHGNINGHDLHVETNLVLGYHLGSSSCSNNADGKRRKTSHDTTLPIMAGTLDLELRLAS